MRLRRVAIGAALTAGLVMVLSSCGALAPADDLTTENVLGEWKLGAGGSTATISMHQDGGFVARSWPSNLLCSPSGATTVGDLEWDDLLTIRGTWQQGTDFPSLLILMPDEGMCSGASWLFDVWEYGTGDYRIQVFLDGVRDPESASDDQSVWISKVPAD